MKKFFIVFSLFLFANFNIFGGKSRKCTYYKNTQVNKQLKKSGPAGQGNNGSIYYPSVTGEHQDFYQKQSTATTRRGARADERKDRVSQSRFV